MHQSYTQDRINTQVVYRFALAKWSLQVKMFYLTIVNWHDVTVTLD